MNNEITETLISDIETQDTNFYMTDELADLSQFSWLFESELTSSYIDY